MLDPWATTTPRRPSGSHPSLTDSQVRGRLPARLADELDGFTVDAGPTTTLTGPVADPAALYGLIARLECLGLNLLSVHPATGCAAIPTSAHRDVTDHDEEHDDA